MPGRKYQSVTLSSAEGYRFGFNGQEKSPEIAQNITTAEFWQYDARIARRWNVDPVIKEYESPYAALSGNPIWLMDQNGADTTLPRAGTGRRESITLPDGVDNIEVYYNNEYTIDGGKQRVNVYNGELRSFKHYILGTFNASWYIYEPGVSPTFAGYRNEKGETFDEAVKKFNVRVALEYDLDRFHNWINDPINQVTLIALPLQISRSQLNSGSSSAGNPTVVLKQAVIEESELLVQTELRAVTTQNVFIVTTEGVVLPKGAKIPSEFVQNPFRNSSFGVFEAGKFVEKVRVDPATPAGIKGPNFSHFHLNGKSKHLINNWPWW